MKFERYLPTIKDSRGRESHTLLFVGVAAMILVTKFLVAGLILPVVGLAPSMSATEFGAAFALIMAIWLGREWTEKKNG